MKSSTIYYQCDNQITCISYKKATQRYPMHTHTAHITLGYVTDGAVCIVKNGRSSRYYTGEQFFIMPDIPHTLEPVNNMPYSMVTVCIPVDDSAVVAEKQIDAAKQLKQLILNAPEEPFPIADMAQCVNISPYHMIRQFKAFCGLTPHQFQIQCRVRKAQKLLEEGKSVVEAAYATGFCDQSHFDRCFYKLVRLTPSTYKLSVK